MYPVIPSVLQRYCRDFGIIVRITAVKYSYVYMHMRAI